MFTLVLCLTLSGCAVSENDVPAGENVSSQVQDSSVLVPEGSENSSHSAEKQNEFDTNLVGSWLLVSETDNGDTGYPLGTYLSFLYDGRFYGDLLGQYDLLRASGLECPTTTADGTNIYLIDDLQMYVKENQLGELSNLENAVVTYELSDISSSQRDDAGSKTGYFFKKYPNDLLTFHVTGTYNESPVSVLEVDSTLVYQKVYPYYDGDTLYGILNPTLEGRWTDNYNNIWEFYYDEDGEFCFTLTDSDGTVYSGNYVLLRWNENDEKCVETLSFSFDDIATMGSMSDYAINHCDGHVIELTDPDGKELVLTRKGE